MAKGLERTVLLLCICAFVTNVNVKVTGGWSRHDRYVEALLEERLEEAIKSLKEPRELTCVRTKSEETFFGADN